jgi:hypothetical protein
MPPITLDDGDGYADVEVRTAAGPLRARLDLYEANNAYAALERRHAGDAVALGAAWADWLAGKGLAGLSHGAAFRVADHVFAAVEEFKKKGPASLYVDSPGSTGSPSSG